MADTTLRRGRAGPATARRRSRAGAIWAKAVAVLVAGAGLLLLFGRGRPILLDGGWYDVFAGLALLVAGIGLWELRRAGFVLCLLVWIAALAWAAWDVGADPEALAMRLAVPTALLLAVLTALPFLDARRGTRRR